jgi:heterotetrameric sarcosine oxidase gamma subunit
MTGALAFLHADTADGLVARSPLARVAGVRTELRAGWEVATADGDASAQRLACDERVGFADSSQLGKLELQAPAAALDALDAMPALGDGLAARGGAAWWCRVTPERALVLCDPGATATLRERLTAALPGHVLDVTTVYGALALAGPLARETFARFCALDLRPHTMPPGAFRPGSVARTPGFVLCEAPDRFLMLFGAAYGAYVWEVVADAAAQLGGRPVGAAVLAALSAEAPSHA